MSTFSISVFLLGILLVFQGRQRPKSISWCLQTAILFCLLFAILFSKAIQKPPTRFIVIDMSFSFQPRVYHDLKQPASQIRQEINSFVQKAPAKVGLLIFAKDYQLLVPPTQASHFLENSPLSLKKFSQWQTLLDPSETNLSSAERFLVEQYGALEILLFSDGQFPIPKASTSVAYTPILLPEISPETRIISFSGPQKSDPSQSLSFTARFQGTRGEEREFFLFQEEQLLYRKKIEFTDAHQVLSHRFSCPPEKQIGAKKYRAVLSPSAQEFFPQNNSKEWTVFIEEAPPLLLVSSSLEKKDFFRKNRFPFVQKRIEDISQREDILPYKAVLYVPEESGMVRHQEEIFYHYVQQGGILLVFGNPWTSLLSGSKLEQILPILCGAEPEPIEIHFFLDSSGSMNQPVLGQIQTRLQFCLQALYQVHLLLEQLPPSILSRIQYRFWSGQSGRAIPLSIEHLNTIEAKGNTDLGASLTQFLEQVPLAPEKKKRLFFFFSDGETQNRELFLSSSQRLAEYPFQVFCFQLPQENERVSNSMLPTFVEQSSQHRLISVKEYTQLRTLLMQELERETQLFYRTGNFRIRSDLPDVLGYARSRLQLQGLEKITIEKEPFLAVRAFDLGASGFLAIDPQQERWTPSELWDTFFFQEIMPLLEQYCAPDIYWQWKEQTFECYSQQPGPYFLREKDKQWELLPKGFGMYAQTFEDQEPQKTLQLVQNSRVVAFVDGEEEVEWNEMFLQTDRLFQLSSKAPLSTSAVVLAYPWIFMAIFGIFLDVLWKKNKNKKNLY